MTVASSSVYYIGLAFCVAVALKVWRQNRLRRGLPLPPGPTGLPFIGSVFQLNAVHPWLTYAQWGKEHGGLVYAKLLGKDFIIINSIEVAHDLLERRSTIYSDRPYIPANELFGMDFNSGLLTYGNTWRLHRKLFNYGLNKETAISYGPLSVRKARQFVENLFDVPKDFARHSRTFATATIMGAIYGYEVAPKDDPFVTTIDRLAALFLTALTPERAVLLLAFPFLAYIPSWMPGGQYKKRAAECRLLAEEVLNSPVEYVIKNMTAGTAKESFVHGLLETSKEHEEAIKAVAASAFIGGADTSDTTMRTFILAMVLNPEVQVKAREEIDRVVGNNRLLDFDDRPNLPYVEAVYRETLRWRPAVPSALPHMTANSDIYEGMYIPKGAIVLTNIWAITHDDTRFDDPMSFIPERHLAPDGTLVEGTLPFSLGFFGYGRRICPGRYFADQNVWAAIATILGTVDIGKARDALGNGIEVKVEFTGGLSSAPKPFMCSITPRSSCAEDLIRTRCDEH